MAYVKGQPFKPQFTDPATNTLMSNGTVEFYLTGTSTPTPYYTDSSGTAGGTSLTLDSGGKPSTDVFFDTAITYKLVVKNAAGGVVETLDPYSAILNADASVFDFTYPAENAVARAISAALADAVSVKNFGAVGDDGTNDGTALMNAFQYGMDYNKTIYIPSGTYRVSRNTLLLRNWSGGSFCIRGDGATSIIKAEDDTFTGTGQLLMEIAPDVDMDRIELRDFVLDMNARSVTTHPGGGAWEQSHCLRFGADTGTTTTHLKYENLVWRDAIGDGVNNQGAGRLTQWEIINCREEIRSYTRSSIQQSRMADNLTIIGFTGDSIESEPVATPDVTAVVNIVGCNLNRLDAAGPSISDRTSCEYFVTGSTISEAAELGLCYFKISDSTIKIPSTGRINYPAKGSGFADSRILLPYDSDTTTLTGLDFYAQAGEFGVRFDECEFLADTSDSGTFSGTLLKTGLACAVADVDNWLWEFNNCKFDPRAQRTANIYRGGTWKFHNPALAGHEYAFYLASSSTYGTKCYVDGADCSLVTGAFVGGAWSTPDQSTTIAQMFLSGDFIGDQSGVIATVSGGASLAATTMIQSRRNLMLDALPASGIKGDKTVLAGVAVGEGCAYQATVNSTTAPNYRLTRQAGIASDTTVNRPTPSANDVGLMYIDTTLDADGHPIWWSGTAWIDAQGATV